MKEVKEEWRAIPGFEGLYEVSSIGRVKSLERKVRCGSGYGDGSFRHVAERMLSLTKNTTYVLVALSKDNKQRSRSVHQLVAIAFLDHTPNGHMIIVDHKNGDKHDNRVENLQLITQIENMARALGYVCPHCGKKATD